MTSIFFQSVLCLLVARAQGKCVTPSVTTFSYYGQSGGAVCPGDLIFKEDFDTLNTDLWSHEVTLSSYGNGEFQYYDDDRRVSFVQGGVLHIRPTLTTSDRGDEFLHNGTLDLEDRCTTQSQCSRTAVKRQILNPVVSARLGTRGAFSYRYGNLEVRLKVPAGDWLRPGFRLWPANLTYGPWPMSGEMQVMESGGNVDLRYPFTVTAGLHWGHKRNDDMWPKTNYERSDPNGYHTGFHTFRVKWAPTVISFSVDSEIIGSVHPPAGGFWEFGRLNTYLKKNPWAGHDRMAPFDKEFYVLINLAVGGVSWYFPETEGKPWDNTNGRNKAMRQFWEGREEWLRSWKLDSDQSHFKVDYVKIWAL